MEERLLTEQKWKEKRDDVSAAEFISLGLGHLVRWA